MYDSIVQKIFNFKMNFSPAYILINMIFTSDIISTSSILHLLFVKPYGFYQKYNHIITIIDTRDY